MTENLKPVFEFSESWKSFSKRVNEERPAQARASRVHNTLLTFAQQALIWLMTPVIFIAKALVTRQNPLKMGRGMDFMHNVVDWVGGYPYEYASIDEMKTIMQTIGMKVVRVFPAVVPTGCNEFLCSD